MGTLPDVLQQLGVPLLLALQARELLEEVDPHLLRELHLRDGTAQHPRWVAGGVRSSRRPRQQHPLSPIPRWPAATVQPRSRFPKPQ